VTRRDELVAGIRGAIPIILGYLPIGMAYGVLAARAGLNTYIIVLMSILVFAGSAQLISINMLGMGAGILPIVLMTFLVNLRHLLMSASMSLHFKKNKEILLPFLAFLITDESFALASASINKYKNRDIFFLGLGLTAYLGWIISSFLGASLNAFLPDTNLTGLDFVLPAMFIALLVLQIKERFDILVALMAGFFSLLFTYLLPGNWNIILATIIAATMGVLIEKWNI
jgi:4-azaleucine resistance transporter AzlC